MTIRKYLGKESNLKRCVPIKCVPVSTFVGSKTSRIILRVHRLPPVRMRMENRLEKSAKQESITSCTEDCVQYAACACEKADSLRKCDLYYDRQISVNPVDGFGPKFYI
ncbi:hypothetical protein AVEN_36937-1 [Araneus ventricosus]|uniref:Uncharacterized protein n=1 Tax=Araneus ventricosus TaxID=182803 RepID=A0A4Y2G862_ARAVE|nr:hypothetical protein AVEN_36937-1 [Araneus ventricosus]